MSYRFLFWLATLSLFLQPGRGVGASAPDLAEGHERRLYVAVPGIRNYLDYGGHGLLVYDIDHGHRLIKRIPTAGLDAKGVPNNVKGICASALTKRIYISTIQQLMCLDLVSEKLLWEKAVRRRLRSDVDHTGRSLDLSAVARRGFLERGSRR